MEAWLQLNFAGADPAAVVEGALAAGLLPATPPTSVKIDAKVVKSPGPLTELATTSEELGVSWGDDAAFQRGRKHDRTYIHRTRWELTPEQLLSSIAAWPFEACLTSPIDPSWWEGYRSIHGWGFLLKGAGHRLVSKRIVDRGPWRRLRDEANDVTLFQFHDLAADADTALAQARPGHALLAPAWKGGHYASQLWAFRGPARAYKPTFYEPATRTSVVLVQEREVTPDEMGIAAASRVHQLFPEPVDNVRFVYVDEAMARRQLPLLWLHGLEVHAMTAGGEQRIDEDYDPPPPPSPPDWIQRLA
jgi:hypothetical protein